MNRNKLMFFNNFWRIIIVGIFTLIMVACKSQMPMPQKPESPQLSETISFPSQIVDAGTLDPTQILIEPTTYIPIPSSTPQSTLYSTPVPLSMSVISTCPVSLPNLSESPDPYYISDKYGYGNPEQTMFIDLWKDGVVYFCPNCAGNISPDGHMSMKFWFYRTMPGEVIFEGRRIGEAGEVDHLDSLGESADGYGETGFHPVGLVFPGQGCWEVTARIGETQMTFVTLVIWVPFDFLWPGWFPAGGLVFDGPDLSSYPNTFGLVFKTSENREIVLQTSQLQWEDTNQLSVQESVKVGENEGICFINQGNELTSGELKWSSGDLNYRIKFNGLDLTCNDLARMAGS